MLRTARSVDERMANERGEVWFSYERTFQAGGTGRGHLFATRAIGCSRRRTEARG